MNTTEAWALFAAAAIAAGNSIESAERLAYEMVKRNPDLTKAPAPEPPAPPRDDWEALLRKSEASLATERSCHAESERLLTAAKERIELLDGTQARAEKAEAAMVELCAQNASLVESLKELRRVNDQRTSWIERLRQLVEGHAPPGQQILEGAWNLIRELQAAAVEAQRTIEAHQRIELNGLRAKAKVQLEMEGLTTSAAGWKHTAIEAREQRDQAERKLAEALKQIAEHKEPTVPGLVQYNAAVARAEKAEVEIEELSYRAAKAEAELTSAPRAEASDA